MKRAEELLRHLKYELGIEVNILIEHMYIQHADGFAMVTAVGTGRIGVHNGLRDDIMRYIWIFAQEMKHIQQMSTGELAQQLGDHVTWDGRRYSVKDIEEIPHEDRPWEIEANDFADSFCRVFADDYKDIIYLCLTHIL